MAWWDLSDGTSAVENAATYEDKGNNFEPLPSGSLVLAEVHSAGWKTDQDGRNRRVAIRYSILEPAQYAKRQVSQPLWVTDDNPNKQGDAIQKKRDMDKQRFGKLDACCGARLSRLTAEPTDDQIALALVSKIVMLELDTIEGTDGKPGINWVRNVYLKGAKAVHIPGGAVTAKATPKTTPAANNSFSDDLGDDIPF